MDKYRHVPARFFWAKALTAVVVAPSIVAVGAKFPPAQLIAEAHLVKHAFCNVSTGAPLAPFKGRFRFLLRAGWKNPGVMPCLLGFENM